MDVKETLRGYHFLREDMRSGEGDEPPWTVGEERKVKGKVVLCKRGYHYSPTLWDALQYAPGTVACLVEVVPHTADETKGVSRTRKLLAAQDISRELRLFAADCAERVLYLFEREYPEDDRPRKAIEAARAYARGEIASAASAAWAASAASAARAASAASAESAARAASAESAESAESAASAARAASAEERAWQQAQFGQRFGAFFADMEAQP